MAKLDSNFLQGNLWTEEPWWRTRWARVESAGSENVRDDPNLEVSDTEEGTRYIQTVFSQIK